MYKIKNTVNGEWLIGTSGKVKWTTEKNARIFKRREDVRNFLAFAVAKNNIRAWAVVRYEQPRSIGVKLAEFVLTEGII